MLSNAHFLARFGFDTVENETARNSQNFVKNALLVMANSYEVPRRGRGGPGPADHPAPPPPGGAAPFRQSWKRVRPVEKGSREDVGRCVCMLV